MRQELPPGVTVLQWQRCDFSPAKREKGQAGSSQPRMNYQNMQNSLFCTARLHGSLQQTAPISRGQTESNSLNHLNCRAVLRAACWALTQVLGEGPGQQQKELTRRWGAAQALAMHRLYLPLPSSPSAAGRLHGVGPWSGPGWHPPRGWPGHT